MRYNAHFYERYTTLGLMPREGHRLPLRSQPIH